MDVKNEASKLQSTIKVTMRRIGEQQGKTVPHLADDLLLQDTGLDSLCIAILVATLDDEFGVDPFSGDGSVTFPVTVGNFVSAYERATG